MAAASSLSQLIRRARFAADERRAELAAILGELERSDAALAVHDAVAETEREALPDRPVEIMARHGAWARHHAQARTRLADLNNGLRRTAEAAQATLAEACAELKRLELAAEARAAAEKKAAEKRAEAKAEEVELIRRIGAPAPAAP